MSWLNWKAVCCRLNWKAVCSRDKQNQLRAQLNKHGRTTEFQVGGWVFIKLQPLLDIGWFFLELMRNWIYFNRLDRDYNYHNTTKYTSFSCLFVEESPTSKSAEGQPSPNAIR